MVDQARAKRKFNSWIDNTGASSKFLINETERRFSCSVLNNQSQGSNKQDSKNRFSLWIDNRKFRQFSITEIENSKFNCSVVQNIISRSDSVPFAFLASESVEPTAEEALSNAENLMLWLTSLEGIPEEICQIPEEEKEVIESFWTALIRNPALSDQLLEPLQTLRPDPNQLIPQLQYLVEQVREQLSAQLPQTTLQNLEAVVQEINITPTSPSIEEICEAIAAEVENMESRGDVDILSMINSLSEEAKNWLGQFLLHLVQNPDLEADLRDRLELS